MKYVAFEAGGRTGFSAMLFFMSWHQSGDILYLADDDVAIQKLTPPSKDIVYCSTEVAINILNNEDSVVFPSDELTRQSNTFVRQKAALWCYSDVSAFPYSKKSANGIIQRLCSETSTQIMVPRTFDITDAFVRPDTFSAGSKGVTSLDNVCVTENINIKSEYVVDFAVSLTGECQFYGRQVVLRNGYDRIVKLLPSEHHVVQSVINLVRHHNSKFIGIWNMKLAENDKGQLYFIEFAKRISGTSFVHISQGYNPFRFFNGVCDNRMENIIKDEKWYRYEDYIMKFNSKLYESL